jgi:uncharacterized repeat protein (TIGR01451 family)
MTDNPDPVKVRTQLIYTLTVRNNGPSAAAGVMVNDTLPSGVTLGSVTTTQGSCSGSVTCNLGTMASGAVATITINVTPQATGTLTNLATVSGSTTDPNAGNNETTATTTVTTSGQPFKLTVKVTGKGSGTVTSDPPGINNCKTTCSATYSGGTSVTLTAAPTGVSRFDHWEGDCSSAGTATSCTVNMTQPRNVTAVFAK